MKKKKHDKKMDLCKVPGVTFLWNKKKTTKKDLSVFIFYFQLQSLFPFFSGVLVKWPFVC